jgi:hypothetical protein
MNAKNLKPETRERLAKEFAARRETDRVARRQAWLARIADYEAKGWSELAAADRECFAEAYPNS